MDYGKNLTWFLQEVGCVEPEDIESGAIEIIGENEQGQEGHCEIEITELALAASNRIIELEQQLDWLLSKVGVNESSEVYLSNAHTKIDKTESLKNIKHCVETRLDKDEGISIRHRPNEDAVNMIKAMSS